MFKVGDRVRCVADAIACRQNDITYDKTYVVVVRPEDQKWERGFDNGNGVFITKDRGLVGFCFNERFELVEEDTSSASCACLTSITKQDGVRVRIAVEGATTRSFSSLIDAQTYAKRYYMTTGLVPRLHVFQDFYMDWTPDVH